MQRFREAIEIVVACLDDQLVRAAPCNFVSAPILTRTLVRYIARVCRGFELQECKKRRVFAVGRPRCLADICRLYRISELIPVPYEITRYDTIRYDSILYHTVTHCAMPNRKDEISMPLP